MQPSIEEASVRLSILPIRLNIDQVGRREGGGRGEGGGGRWSEGSNVAHYTAST